MEKDLRIVKYFAFLASVFLFGVIVALATGHAQVCEFLVSDEIQAFGGNAKIMAISDAAKPLIEQGADVRVIATSLENGGTLEEVIAERKKDCKSWQSPNGGVKANMLVFAVAPRERKMAIFYGPGYKAALEGQVDRIKRDFMGPRFRGGDWAGGIIAGEQQVGARIKASLDESNKPVTVTNETVNQPTDLHGLWIFLWILGGLLTCGCLWFLIYKMRKNREDKETAQQDAIAARSRTINLLNSLNQQTSKYSDLTTAPAYIKKAFSIVDTVSSQITMLASSLSGDPTTEGMGVSFYRSLFYTYDRLEKKLELAKAYIDTGDTPVDKTETKTKKSTKVKAAYSGEQSATPAPVPSPAPTPAPAPQTVVVREDSNNDLLTGVLLGEAINSNREPEYREPEPERHTSHHHDDDDSSSSSSSSWGGSSSDSSSSSSDWGGGSSDFGSSDSGGGSFGGGSSDF